MATANAQRARKRPASSKRTRSSSERGRSGSANGSRSQAKTRTVRARTHETGHAVERAAKSTGQAVGQAASKAKGPAIAGGAALAGLAGGLALAGTRVRSRRVLGVPIPRRSRLAKTGRSFGQAAGQVGLATRQLAVLTEEIRRAREQAEKADRRSPVEVLLSGLTNRKLGG